MGNYVDEVEKLQAHEFCIVRKRDVEFFETFYFDVDESGIVFIDFDLWFDNGPSDLVLNLVITV